MKIYWKNCLIAEITSHKPRAVSGSFFLVENIPSEVSRYIEFCTRFYIGDLDGHFTDEYYSEEKTFINLIENSEWWLITENGYKKLILIPIFYADNEVTWHYDTER